ncbi:hypothetical protein THIOM_003348 [Candidatus Thiomargarita nelsonii]|uniref:Uncharacterized protein n=1 Tax=Candidatus Thiomargarita nelsonii TaxID=1003181 RepID=A0A176RYW9_9GAMM|nr:hypothetical protein THIOM_003348 [Candidatus Thiomargarita nelsonii]
MTVKWLVKIGVQYAGYIRENRGALYALQKKWERLNFKQSWGQIGLKTCVSKKCQHLNRQIVYKNET